MNSGEAALRRSSRKTPSARYRASEGPHDGILGCESPAPEAMTRSSVNFNPGW